MTPVLEPLLTSYYMYLIRILRWVVKLDQVDILVKVLFLASHMEITGEVKIEVALHVFSHLKIYN